MRVITPGNPFLYFISISILPSARDLTVSDLISFISSFAKKYNCSYQDGGILESRLYTSTLPWICRIETWSKHDSQHDTCCCEKPGRRDRDICTSHGPSPPRRQ